MLGLPQPWCRPPPRAVGTFTQTPTISRNAVQVAPCAPQRLRPWPSDGSVVVFGFCPIRTGARSAQGSSLTVPCCVRFSVCGVPSAPSAGDRARVPAPLSWGAPGDRRPSLPFVAVLASGALAKAGDPGPPCGRAARGRGQRRCLVAPRGQASPEHRPAGGSRAGLCPCRPRALSEAVAAHGAPCPHRHSSRPRPGLGGEQDTGREHPR